MKVLGRSICPGKPLFFIFNKCLTSGTFPDLLKYSNVTPIFKSGPKSDITNYRPVCLNNSFAKVFDIILSACLRSHASNAIIDEQHGFVTGKSTETNLFIFTNYINHSIESG